MVARKKRWSHDAITGQQYDNAIPRLEYAALTHIVHGSAAIADYFSQGLQ
jgi:hypothetical protein